MFKYDLCFYIPGSSSFIDLLIRKRVECYIVPGNHKGLVDVYEKSGLIDSDSPIALINLVTSE